MKAILVIDINDDYLEDYENFYVDYDLRAERKDVNVNESIRYVEDCPLKPMPQRKMVGEIEKVDDFMKSDIQIINEKVTAKIMLDTELLLASGYNSCIDEILGEKE